MRVLWFASGLTSEISEHLSDKKNRGSWVESLHKKISRLPEIELGIVFRWNTRNASNFELNRTKYYLVPNEQSFTEKVINTVFCKIDSKRRIEQYVNIINEFNPDVIHVFGTENDFGLIQEYTDVPVVIFMQGMINNYINYYFSSVPLITVLFSTKLFDLLLGSSDSFYHHYIRFKKQAVREKKIFKLTRHVIGFTDFDKRVPTIMGSILSYNYIPVLLRPPFYKALWNNPSKPLFRIISTINPQIYKGLETIYRTSNILNTRYPNEFEFVVVGITPASIINKLIKKTLSKEVVKNSSLRFKGNLDADGLIQELKLSNVFMHPSLCDTGPNSICEAMILGMPVISTNVGGIPSMITDGDTGYLVQNMDHLSFAQIIFELKNNPLQAVALGLKARQLALVRHDEDDIVNKTVSVYNELCNK